MNHQEFVSKISGKHFYFTRTNLCTCAEEIIPDVCPSWPRCYGSGSSIKISMIHCYGPDDLFTEKNGVFVAVIKTGSENIFCDRFVPRSTTT